MSHLVSFSGLSLPCVRMALLKLVLVLLQTRLWDYPVRWQIRTIWGILADLVGSRLATNWRFPGLSIVIVININASVHVVHMLLLLLHLVLNVLPSALTLVHMPLLGGGTVTLRHSSSWSSLVLASDIRKPSLVRVRNLSRLCWSHDVYILTSSLIVVMLQTSYTAGSCIQHLVLLGLAP